MAQPMSSSQGAVYQGDYKNWPFLNAEEFDLACALLDQRYVRAQLGPARQTFRLRHRRILTTGCSYIEILRLLQPPQDLDELTLALERLGGGGPSARGAEGEDVTMGVVEDDDPAALPKYTQFSQQPYVVYEIHLHPTYRVPALWFTLHDLLAGESAFDLDAVYRHLVPSVYKSPLREMGVVGGISAAPHPLTDIPAFFIHPCNTKEAMERFDVALDEYLMVWIGIVGGCVGLWTPLAMAQQ